MTESVLVELPFMEYGCYFNSFESLISYSISSFLSTDSTDPHPYLSEFRSLFSRVLSAYWEPPLEAVWFYSALKFRDAPDNIRSILDLISAFRAASPAAAKPLALLAPVISGLFHSDKPRAKVEALVEAVLGHIISICSSCPAGGDVNADAGRLLRVFPELVKAWIPRDMRDSSPFQVLFPLAGDEARRELMKEGCSVTFLAGVVVAEAFLLGLYHKVHGEAEVPSSERQKRLKTWAVSSIQGFKNQQFVGVLLNILANPPLPVDSLLGVDDQILVRDVLYDALIFSDYLVICGAQIDRPDSSLLPFFLSRVVVTFDAINDARRKGDHERAESYINVFLTSNIPSYLSRWSRLQAGTNHLDKPIAITPRSFLEWLVDLEDKGLKVFGEKCSRIKESLMHDESQNDTKGGEDEEAVEMKTTDNALMAAAHSTKVEDCELEDSLEATNGMSSGRGVENLQSEDEMEETV